ncbi:PREDICTED: uncharacterized protein LOC106740579 [Dinoponera quadriceps]|uniref:Uncharacterized protein LOC106740579 n=1 Tax=Dinoponera quadriceps TaxID=609295 RepID=A0A6P3WME1_DINQU|nr:PREDICTED: uncharacterized protein LOC106740579 [Dinoponera quadriceps]
MANMEGRLKHQFTGCLRVGVFPSRWKRAGLVLIPKEGRPPGSLSAYRPIYLLDEVGKLFERIIATRLVRHLSREGPDLSDRQYGFIAGRSTVDAILHVRAFADAEMEKGMRRSEGWPGWKEQLGGPNLPGQRTIEAIRPCLLEWVSRDYFGLSYHATQVLTGHGCFGEYWCRIGKERTAQCHNCAASRITTQHMLAHCPA